MNRTSSPDTRVKLNIVSICKVPCEEEVDDMTDLPRKLFWSLIRIVEKCLQYTADLAEWQH